MKDKRCFDEKRLSQAQVKESLPAGWRAKRGLIETGPLDFPTFPAAIRFVVRLATVAEKENHHPEIMISWKRVTLQLTTHDAGGVTRLDIRMARLTNSLLRSLGGRLRRLNK
ncbi:MAG: 4a-hydroxytetrahydrobiopterin dehydratase [Candidatus Micrarchaeota archaeon]|nr:4a-hydroxytetrahydrobiopterin dehydratase [Candidatus Micrarchaeota archaeon]